MCRRRSSGMLPAGSADPGQHAIEIEGQVEAGSSSRATMRPPGESSGSRSTATSPRGYGTRFAPWGHDDEAQECASDAPARPRLRPPPKPYLAEMGGDRPPRRARWPALTAPSWSAGGIPGRAALFAVAGAVVLATTAQPARAAPFTGADVWPPPAPPPPLVESYLRARHADGLEARSPPPYRRVNTLGRGATIVDLVICLASVIGSLTIIVPYFLHKRNRKLRHALILGLATSDLVAALLSVGTTSYMIGGGTLDTNQRVCDFSGFVLAVSIFTQHLWNLAIAVITWMILTHPLSRITLTIERYIIWLWPTFWALGMLVNTPPWVLAGWTDIGGYCSMISKPGSLLSPLIQFIPRVFVFTVLLVLYTHLFFFLRRTSLFSKASSSARGTAPAATGDTGTRQGELSTASANATGSRGWHRLSRPALSRPGTAPSPTAAGGSGTRSRAGTFTAAPGQQQSHGSAEGSDDTQAPSVGRGSKDKDDLSAQHSPGAAPAGGVVPTLLKERDFAAGQQGAPSSSSDVALKTIESPTTAVSYSLVEPISSPSLPQDQAHEQGAHPSQPSKGGRFAAGLRSLFASSPKHSPLHLSPHASEMRELEHVNAQPALQLPGEASAAEQSAQNEKLPAAGGGQLLRAASSAVGSTGSGAPSLEHFPLASSPSARSISRGTRPAQIVIPDSSRHADDLVARRGATEGTDDDDDALSEDAAILPGAGRWAMTPRKDAIDFQMTSAPQEHLNHGNAIDRTDGLDALMASRAAAGVPMPAGANASRPGSGQSRKSFRGSMRAPASAGVGPLNATGGVAGAVTPGPHDFELGLGEEFVWGQNVGGPGQQRPALQHQHSRGLSTAGAAGDGNVRRNHMTLSASGDRETGSHSSDSNGQGVESIGSTLNRQASVLMLLYPLAYCILFATSIIRLISDLATDNGVHSPGKNTTFFTISRWFIFAQGAFDAVIFQFVERSFRKRMKRRRRRALGEPIPESVSLRVVRRAKSVLFSRRPSAATANASV